MDKKQTLIVKQFVSRVKSKYPRSRIILFGSRARGKAKKDSDYDFLIISTDFNRIPYDDRAPSIYFLKRDIPAPMDIICATPSEAKKSKFTVIEEAIRDGIDVTAMA
ncbi:MAG: nucleotidyltransferase domain-containing protein [Nanoarchaeota archaeon]